MKCGPGRWRPAVAPRNATRGAGELESSSRTTLLDTQRPRAPARVREMPTSGSAHPGPAPRRDPGPSPRCSSARRPLGTPGRGTPASGGGLRTEVAPEGSARARELPRRARRARREERTPAEVPPRSPAKWGRPLPLSPRPLPHRPCHTFSFCCDKKPLFSLPTKCVSTLQVFFY